MAMRRYTFRMDNEQYQELIKHANGNISRYVREAVQQSQENSHSSKKEGAGIDERREKS